MWRRTLSKDIVIEQEKHLWLVQFVSHITQAFQRFESHIGYIEKILLHIISHSLMMESIFEIRCNLLVKYVNVMQ